MEPRLKLTACSGILALAAISGCKGCEEKPPEPAAAEPERSAQRAESDRARTLSRLSTRKLDRTKVYPADAAGVVQCGRDMDCFILQAERCARAVLEHRQTISGYGIEQYVHARYLITGSEVGRCKIEREALAIDAKLDPKMIAALRKRGKNDQEIESLRADAVDGLRRRNPGRLECFLTTEQALEASLNLAEGRYNPLHWRTACREIAGPPPHIGIAEDGTSAAPAEPARPRKATKADVPVPKQP